MPVNLVFISYLPGQTLVRYAHSRFSRVNVKIHTKFTGIEKGKVIIITNKYLTRGFRSRSLIQATPLLKHCLDKKNIPNILLLNLNSTGSGDLEMVNS